MMDQVISESFLIIHPAVYRIRVSGRMDPSWSERLQGMTLTVFDKEGQGTFTELCGLLPDQAALMGVLDHLNTCGISLLGLECLAAEPGKR